MNVSRESNLSKRSKSIANKDSPEIKEAEKLNIELIFDEKEKGNPIETEKEELNRLRLENDEKGEENKEINKITWKEKCKYYLINLKEVLFIILIISINLVNYSILNILYTIIGLILMFFIFNNDTKYTQYKNILVKITLVYSVLVLIFKLIFLGFYLSNYAEDFVNEYKTLLINLGLKYLQTEELTKFLNTYIPDTVILIVSIFYIIYTYDPNEFITNSKHVIRTFQAKYYFLLSFLMIFLVILVCLNLNFLTLLYSTIFINGLIMIILGKQKDYFYICSYFIIFFCDLHILFVHILNIYDLRHKYLKSNNYIYIKWLGFPKMQTNFTYPVDVIISVLLSLTCIILIKLRNRYDLTCESDPNFKEEERNRERERMDSAGSLQAETNKKGFINKFRKIFKEWVSSPFFILHFCRLGIILYLILFKSVISELIFIWLFYSFLIINVTLLKPFTLIILWPVLIVNFYLYFISNIAGLIKIPIDQVLIFKLLSLERIDNVNFYFLLYFIDLILVTFFTVLLLKFKDKELSKFQKHKSADDLIKPKNQLVESLVNNMKDNTDVKSEVVKRVKPKKQISFYELILKFLLKYIDVITLILMYLIALNEVNILHLILIIIFLIQLILPESIKSLCLSIIIIIEILIFYDFVWDYLNGLYSISPYLYGVMEIIMSITGNYYSKSSDNYLWIILYCFYMQYQIYNSHLYKKYESEDYELKKYLDSHLKNYPNLLYYIHKSIELISQLYIWVIFLLIFIIITLFEINLLFSIKLLLFFIILYMFLDLTYSKNTSNSIITVIWVFIIYCGLVTMAIYFYQFTMLGLFSNWFYGHYLALPDFVKNNLQVIGIQLYAKNELTKRFFPHYFSNLLSVLLLSEVKNQIRKLSNSNKCSSKIKEELEKYEDKLLKRMSTGQVGDLKESNLQIDGISSFSKKKFYFLKILIFLLTCYWLAVFLVVCSLMIDFQISLIMIIYIIVFGFSFIFLFSKFRNLKEAFSNKENTSFYITKLIRYEICEKPYHRKVLKQNRKITLKILFIITLISLWLTYSYGIVDVVKNKVYDKYKTEFDRLEASSYLIGFYYNHTESLFKFIWGYFVLLILLILDRYVQILHSNVLLEILKLEKIAKLIEKKKIQEENKQKEIKILLDEKEKTFLQKKIYSFDDFDNRHSKLERENDIRLKIQEKEEQLQNPISININNIQLEKEDFHNKNQSQVDKENIFIENLERRIDLKVSKLLRRFILIFYNYSSNSKLKPIQNNFTIEVQKSLKHVMEEVIVFMIFLCTVIKLNVFSVIYMFILIFIQIKGRNINDIYIVTIFINILIVIQYSLFFLNLNQNTDPQGYPDILKLVYEIYRIPIYQTYSIDERLAYFLSFGTQQSQVNTIWIEFITVIICFLYLDNFSFSIFEAKGFRKSDFHLILDKSSFKVSVNKIDEIEYNELRENLHNNIDITIPPLEDLKTQIRLGSEVSKEQEKGNNIEIRAYDSVRTYSKIFNKPSDKKKDFFTRLFINLRKNIYLSMHNFMLVLILILSLMNDGLISMVYILYALYYIYISRRFFIGIKWNFPNSLKNFLRIFILVDIFLQILYQNPFNYFLVNDSISDNIMQIIGIYKVVDYSDNSFKKNMVNLSLLILKIITYLLVSLQIIIFNSKQFKAFYIKMLFKQKECNYRASMINSFLFNNTRIKTMNESMAYRNSINETLKSLEKQLESWNKHLKDDEFVPKQSFGDEEKKRGGLLPNKEDFLKKESKIDNISPELSDKENLIKLESLDSSSSSERNTSNRRDIKMRLKIKKILYSKFLIKLAIYLNRKSCSYKFVDKRAQNDFEIRIIKGETYIPSSIEKTIDHFVETLDITNEEMADLAKIIDTEEDIRLKKDIGEKTNIVENQDINELDLKNLELISKKNKEIDEKISKNIFSDKLFKKYLTKCYLFQYCCKKIFYFSLENFHFVCFFFMILNHMLNTSLISLFWPIMVFGYALLEYPKPKNTFWKIALFYSISTIFIKFSFQLRLVDILAPGLNSDDLKNFNKASRIGIFIYEESLSGAFLNYIIWDCIIILLITLQQYILISQGLWDHIESEIESMENAYDRVFISNSDKFKDNLDPHYFINRAVSLHRAVTRKGESFYIEKFKIKRYYDTLFPKTRNYKPGKDFYAVYFIVMLIITGYIIIFYTRMDRNINYQISGVAGIREFSGAMVIMAFIHVFFIVVDRVIYIKQNRNKIELDYFYYNVNTGEKITLEEYKEQITSEIDDKNYKMIYFQNEETNVPLISKYIIHCIIILFSHVIIFWFLPIQGNMNLTNNAYCTQPISNNNPCNDFGYNGYIVFCYLLYLIYLIFSAMQIKYGLLDMRKKSLLTRGDNIVYSSCYKGFLAIPFLYELKLCLDWTFTPTSLDLFKWLKFEAVYDILFITHCDKKVEGKRKIGEVVGNVQKFLLGGCGFFILLIILLLPLILFSSLNPANVLNNVTDANIELQISFSQSGISNNYSIYKNSYASNIQKMTKSTWDAYGYGKSIYTKGFDFNQVQIISMYNTSDNMWGISFPHIDLIKERLKNYNNSNYDIYFNFKYSFTRPQPAGAQNSLKSFTYPLFLTLNSSFSNPSFKNKTDLLDRFYRDLTVCGKEEMILENFYIPSIRLSAEPHPKTIRGSDSDKLPFRNVKLNFECEFNTSVDPHIDFTKSYYNLSMYNPPDKIEQGIVFHTFSDKVSSTNTSYDVITFYISFILVVGRLVRGAISGEAERIVFTEMPEPKKILNLCEGVKIHRYRSEFEREEHLYYVLIDLMRSPEILKIITKSSIRFLLEKKEKERKKEKITKKLEKKEDEKEKEEENKLIEEIKEYKEKSNDNNQLKKEKRD